MSDVYWVGGAPAVAQVSSVQVTAYDVATTYKLTVGGTNGAPSVVITAIAAGSVNATATALAAAWNASTHPYCAAVTAVASTDTVTLTADVPGVPFVVAKSVSGGTGTLGAVTAVTASSGPNDWSTAANWSGGAVPVNSDNIYIRASAIPILWGLAQSGVTPSLLVIDGTFTNGAQLGLPAGQFTKSLTTSDLTVPEYRQSYLAIGAAVVRRERNFTGNAKGSPLIKIDTGSTAAAYTIYATGVAADAGPALLIKAASGSATLKVYDGKVGVCWEVPNESGQLSEIDVYAGGNVTVYVGSGVTLGTHLQESGNGVLKCLPTTLKIEDGATVTLANPAGGTITTLEKRGELELLGVAFAVTNLKG